MELESRSEWKLLKQGAEARVYSCLFFDRPAVVKERFVKSYRLPELDKKLTQRSSYQFNHTHSHTLTPSQEDESGGEIDGSLSKTRNSSPGSLAL